MKNTHILLLIIVSIFIIFTFVTVFGNDLLNHTVEYISTEQSNSINQVSNKLPGERDLPGNAPERGMGVAIFKTEDDSTPLSPTINLADGNLSCYLEISNCDAVTNQFLIITLLDYNLTPYTYNNNYSVLEQIINVSGKKALIRPFYISNISPGYHDLQIFLIRNPYAYYQTTQLTNPYTHKLQTVQTWDSTMELLSLRFNVINENNQKPDYQFNNTGIENISSSATFRGTGIITTRGSISDKEMTYVNTSANSTTQFNINVANTVQDNCSYAIVGMLDGVQIPLYVNSSDLVYYGYLRMNETCSIPVTVRAPDSRGIHELRIIMVPEPYVDVETEPGVYNPDVIIRTFSERIGIYVN